MGHAAGQCGSTTEYYYTDYHGSVVQHGDVTYSYDAYGNQQDSTTDTNPFRYCGEYWDNESGLVYLRARYYDAGVGGFISEDPAKDGLNWYVYCGGNPVNFWDPSGEDAIIITNKEAVPVVGVAQGHTSAIYQNANGEWFYTYWGNNAAAVIKMPDTYMGSLSSFNTGLNNFLAAWMFSDITSDYTDATYIVGDFTASLEMAYNDVNEAAINNYGIKREIVSLEDGSVVFQGKNYAYGALNANCFDKTYASLSKGTLANGMNTGSYMKERGFKGGMIPNNAIDRFSEVFINSSFTYNGAYERALNYATLYMQNSSWAQVWIKANYANAVVGW